MPTGRAGNDGRTGDGREGSDTGGLTPSWDECGVGGMTTMTGGATTGLSSWDADAEGWHEEGNATVGVDVSASDAN